jgi:hypothetical protein
VTRASGSPSQVTSALGAGKLDAGAISLNGPPASSIVNVALTKDAATNAYFATLATEGISIPGVVNPALTAGTYTLSGAGGTDVGKFTASVTLGTPLAITGGLPIAITRASGLQLAWTGGNPSDTVTILGLAGQTTGAGTTAVVEATAFRCTTTAGQGGIRIGADILSQLPAVTSNALSNGTGLAVLQVLSSVNPTTSNGLFTAPLTAGGSITGGFFLGAVGIGGFPEYQ